MLDKCNGLRVYDQVVSDESLWNFKRRLDRFMNENEGTFRIGTATYRPEGLLELPLFSYAPVCS